jgi:AbrB family looped-hinge helix DNA binding protein
MIATTKMSSKGQVVIPEELRERMNLSPGSQFIVVGEGDVVILKILTTPSMKQFDELIRKARQQARSTGMTPQDVDRAIAKVRERR